MNFLSGDCNSDTQVEQIEMNGRYLFHSTLALSINSQYPLIVIRTWSFKQVAKWVFAYVGVALHVLGEYKLFLATLLSEGIKSLQ